MKRTLTVYLLVLFATLSATAQGDNVIRILAIGNSFSEDAVEQYLYELAHEAGYELIIGNAYKGGQSLEGHWKEVMADSKVLDYRKVVGGKKTNYPKRDLQSIIEDEPWDFITLQQASHFSGQAETYEPWLSKLIAYIKVYAKNDDARIGFHMTWAYSQDSNHGGFANYGRDQMTMYQAICNAVDKSMNKHKELSFLIPSGTAIQNARTSPLGDTLCRDGFHLDLNTGRYVAACTWLAAILDENPKSKKFRPEKTDEEAAKIAQKAACKAVKYPMKVSAIK